MTSSPEPMPSASSTRTRASVPLATPTVSGTSRYAAASRSNAATFGPRMNSPLASTPSIASRMRGKSGSYWSFTSTSGIGRTIRKSRASALEDQIGRQCDNCDDHRVLDETEVVVEVLVAPSGAPADAGEGKGPDCRADGRQQDIAPEGHSEDAGRNRDERPDDRGHPADQHRQVVPAVEPALRPIELVARKVKPASTPFEQRPPPVQADGP